MSSTSVRLANPPESVHDRLRNLARADRSTHWLTSDLSLTPSSIAGRFFFTVMIKHSCGLRRLFFGIDLEDAKRELIRIGWQEIDLRNYSDVHLYRKAVKAFKKLAPRHALPKVRGYYLERLRHCFARYVFTNLIGPAALPIYRINLLSQNPEVGLPYHVIYNAIRDFEKRGGHVQTLWSRDKREHDEGFILRKTDDIAPVCHAGLVRSKIIKEAIEQKLEIKTRDTHGVLTGYGAIQPTQQESDFEEYFEEAFLKKRSKRFGYNILPAQLDAYFNKHYWGKINPNGRVIFIAFSNAFTVVLDKLKKHHPNLDQVHVLIIPDGDWISHFKGQKPSQEAFYDSSKTDEEVASILVSLEPYLLNNPAFDRDDYFIRAIGKARLDLKNPHVFFDFMQPYIYRFACYYYSNFFNLET